MKTLAGGGLAALLVFVLLPACGTKTNESSRAAGMVPANAVSFVSASLDPSIAQKKNLLSIATKFPKERSKVTKDFTQTRDNFLAESVKSACLDYQNDVKPWLGSEIAVATLPKAGGNGTDSVLLIRTKNDAKAQAALQSSYTPNCPSTAPRPRQFRIVNGFAVIAPNGGTAALDAVSATTDPAKSLANAAAFARLVDELHGDRLLVGYADAKALLDANGGRLTANGCDVVQAAGLSGKAAFDLHAESSSFVLDGVGDQGPSPLKAGDPKLTEGLPASATGALTVFDIGGLVRTALTCSGAKAAVTGNLADQTGLDLDADVLSWMSGEASLVTGPFHAGRTLPDIGLLVQATGHAAAAGAVDKLKAKLTEDGAQLVDFDIPGSSTKGSTIQAAATDGTQPALVLMQDRFVLATTPDFARQLAQSASPTLGQAAFYRSVIGAGSSSETEAQLAVNVRAIKDAIVSSLPAAERERYQKNVAPQLDPIQALGIKLYQQAGLAHAQMKVTVG